MGLALRLQPRLNMLLTLRVTVVESRTYGTYYEKIVKNVYKLLNCMGLLRRNTVTYP